MSPSTLPPMPKQLRLPPHRPHIPPRTRNAKRTSTNETRKERERDREKNTPNLQRPRTQHARTLILGHIRSRTPLIIRNLLLPQTQDRIFLSRRRTCPSSIWAHNHHIPIPVRMRRRRAVCDAFSGLILWLTVRVSRTAIWILDIVGIGGLEGWLVVVECGLIGLVTLGARKGRGLGMSRKIMGGGEGREEKRSIYPSSPPSSSPP